MFKKKEKEKKEKKKNCRSCGLGYLHCLLSISNACNLSFFYTREDGLVWRRMISDPHQVRNRVRMSFKKLQNVLQIEGGQVNFLTCNRKVGVKSQMQ